jgi:hypothetical protein
MTDVTYAVTLVKAGSGYPVFEVGAYRYSGPWLPDVGEIITITKAPGAESDGPEEQFAYVTRVDATAETPIRVMEAVGHTVDSADDYIVTN